MKPPRDCSCGSGLNRFELRDAAGNFCTYVCNKCEAEKKSRYDPKIFNPNSRYATHGTEDALEADDYD